MARQFKELNMNNKTFKHEGFFFFSENFIKKDIHISLYHGHTKCSQFPSAHEMTQIGLLAYEENLEL